MELTIDIHYNLDQCQNNYIGWKETDFLKDIYNMISFSYNFRKCELIWNDSRPAVAWEEGNGRGRRGEIGGVKREGWWTRGLDCTDIFMGVYISQNSTNCTLKYMQFFMSI